MAKRVLLVTNDLLTEETLCRPLQKAGYKVVPASNVRDSVAHSSAAPLDLWVVDLDGPLHGSGDGRDVINQVLEICPSEPIIVISGRGDLSEAIKSLGAAAVIGKPIDVPALLQTADALLAQPVHRSPPNNDALRRALLERAHAPFVIARQPRGWGLNE